MKQIWIAIKNWLARLLPAPMRSFKREMQALREKTDAQMKLIKDMEKQLSAQTKLLNDLEKQIRQDKRALSKQLYEFLDPQLYPHALSQWYHNKTGNPLDLENPRTYNEKIQWMKLYDHDPRKAQLTDKLLVRDWVRDKIGEAYLIPLLASYERAADIDFDSLPDRFVLKANHGSGFNAIIRDKHKENFAERRKKADSWLGENFSFNNGFELHYSGIRRRLLVEEYMENADGDMPDYKFWCFGGQVKFIQVIKGRREKTRMALFDPQWKRLPFSTGTYPPILGEVDMPDIMPQMIGIAECLSEGFAHVRVDLYALDSGEIKFGEMTFTTSSGVARWDPPEADLLVGEMFELPKAAE